MMLANHSVAPELAAPRASRPSSAHAWPAGRGFGSWDQWCCRPGASGSSAAPRSRAQCRRSAARARAPSAALVESRLRVPFGCRSPVPFETIVSLARAGLARLEHVAAGGPADGRTPRCGETATRRGLGPLLLLLGGALALGGCGYFSQEVKPYRPPISYGAGGDGAGGTARAPREASLPEGLRLLSRQRRKGTSRGPDLTEGANGAALTDFVLRTGRMPGTAGPMTL